MLVSNDIFADGTAYDDTTKHYMKTLSCVNRRAAALSDHVYEVVCGISLAVK